MSCRCSPAAWCVHCGQAMTTARGCWYWPPDGTCAERLHIGCALAWLALVGEPVVVRLVAAGDREREPC